MKPTQEDLDIAKATEKQLGLPDGSLVGFVAEGGTIDGKRRAKVLDVYGIDAKLNRRNTIEAAGLALQDALSGNDNDPSLALAELYSGEDRSKWGKATTTFAMRAMGARASDGTYLGNRPAPTPVTPVAASSAPNQRSASGAPMARAAGNRSASGLTDPSAPMQTGPAPANTAAAGEPEGGDDAEMFAAYNDGRMDATDKRELERLVSAGAIKAPAGFQLGQTPEPTVMDRVLAAPGKLVDAAKEAVTGDKRRTTTTDSLPSWSQIPEWDDVGTIQNVAALFAAPREALQVLQSASPGVKIREDEKGNLIVFSPKAGGEFAVQPGFDVGDAVRFGATLPIYAAGAATGGLGSIMAREAAVQTGIETTQAASGGEFNPTDIALAGAVPAAMAGVGAGGRRIANTLLDAIPGSTTRQVAGAAADATTTLVDDVVAAAPAPTRLEALAGAAGTALRKRIGPVADAVAPPASVVDDVTKAVPPPASAIDDVTKVVPPPVGAAPTAQAASDTTGTITAAAEKELGPEIVDLIRRASSKDAGAKTAQAELAKAFQVSPAALAAAERLGVDVPIDVLANNVQLKNIVGSLRAKVGTKAEADFAKSMGDTVEKLDEVLVDLGAEASPAGFSDRVLDRFRVVQEGLEKAAQSAYDDVSKVVKKSDNVTLDNLAVAVAERKKEMGGALKGIDADMAAIVDRAKVMPNAKTRDGVLRATFGVIKGEKAQIRKALTRMESAYGSADENVLKTYQRALVADELANVGRIGGDELAEKASLANRLWAQKKEVDEKITAAFGKKESGDISRLLLTSIRDASKGSVEKLNTLLEVLPPEMHGEAIMTALGSLTRAKGGAAASAESFGAAEFVQVYRGLRAKGNERIYGQIEKAVGPKRAAVLRDVYEISRRITDARAVIKGTGKDAQDAIANLAAENVVAALLGSTAGKQAVRGAGAVVGAAIGGLPGAGIGGAAADAIFARIAIGGEEQVIAGGAVMMSPEFKRLAVGLAGNPTPDKVAVRAVVASRPFRDWAKAAMLPREPKALEQWMMAAIQGARTPTTDAKREDR